MVDDRQHAGVGKALLGRLAEEKLFRALREAARGQITFRLRRSAAA